MVNSKTVFIIGSGASKEADLPTSDELKSKIVNKLSIQFYPEFYGDIRILDAIRHHAQNSSERKGLKYYEDAARYIKRELPAGKSIDQFLDLQRNSKMVQLCGKLAITMCILQAERDSKLYFDKDHGEKLSKTKLAHTWYIRLWQLLSTGSHAGDFHDIFDDVSFIVFNYDRCLEYFLINIIADQYDIEAIKSEDLVKKLEFIIHMEI